MQPNPLIIALDFPGKADTERFLRHFSGETLFVKVGMELFYKEGVPLIHDLKAAGHHLFLDLKLHDIPTTVRRAMKQLASLEVDIVNVHAMGGTAMMVAAQEGLDEGTPAGRGIPSCIAVTQLTSMTEKAMNEQLYIAGSLMDHVLHLCGQVKAAGLAGVVCSAQEVPAIREAIGSQFFTVTPGIRMAEDEVNDQHRVVTPADAAKLGADAIVVGRGITRAADPLAAYRAYETEWRNRG
ncbi:orotidine-5'-phosphate decarboxylase [Evansella caseinilytica]|uniref:Orotidine 5'-phosphate decarboxylase n=1 Tax=Evansella caseinilytica TaxID=1503961 RepID=A0A1H3MEP0_9BACI|nr:orotidine-5'-phosphate decarboxylase [Evansella caseinilytica]SDY74794.1 orotidine-5'-phosphate decarboxylase [Evansella caseinilytica]